MKLIIAEKPSVAQGIAKVVGADKKENGYVVSWCLGHMYTIIQGVQSQPRDYGCHQWKKKQ